MAHSRHLRWERCHVLGVAQLGALLVATLLGCDRAALERKEEGAARAQPAELVVFAASSLTEAFGDLERSFEAANAGVDVKLSYGGSQVLKLQISEGAPSDVFASADDAHMRELVSAGLAHPSQTFAHNELVIVVPADNPAQITELRDLPRAQRLVIGAPSVPIGAYTRELLVRASRAYGAGFEKDVLARVVSEESNVRLVRAKVELGEADAALVYRTDAASAKLAKVDKLEQVKQVALPSELNVRASYPIAVLTRTARTELARRWVAHVLSPTGKASLAARGFLVDGGSVARGVP